MNRLGTFAVLTSALLLAFALPAGDALAQQKSLKEQLVGSWALVSNNNIAPDGTKRQVLGPNPKGIFIFDSSGRYAQIMLNPNRPKFKGSTRLDGTPEENKAVVQGTSAQFGTWSVDEAKKTLISHIEHHLFPNDDGTDSVRAITLTGDELTVITPAASSGGKSTLVFRRVK
jgi:hypothetical protein